jgi:hypothetical protein
MADENEIDEAFRDTVSHVDQEGHRVWFYPKKPLENFTMRELM